MSFSKAINLKIPAIDLAISAHTKKYLTGYKKKFEDQPIF